jgi:hypothetical protein
MERSQAPHLAPCNLLHTTAQRAYLAHRLVPRQQTHTAHSTSSTVESPLPETVHLQMQVQRMNSADVLLRTLQPSDRPVPPPSLQLVLFQLQQQRLAHSQVSSTATPAFLPPLPLPGHLHSQQETSQSLRLRLVLTDT